MGRRHGIVSSEHEDERVHSGSNLAAFYFVPVRVIIYKKIYFSGIVSVYIILVAPSPLRSAKSRLGFSVAKVWI